MAGARIERDSISGPSLVTKGVLRRVVPTACNATATTLEPSPPGYITVAHREDHIRKIYRDILADAIAARAKRRQSAPAETPPSRQIAGGIGGLPR